METIRFATIGTGVITEHFIAQIPKVEEAELVACHSRDVERAREFGEPFGATLFFDDVEELAACDEIDAVYVASPNCFHHDQALACIRAGKHVLVEKPFAGNAREAREMLDAAREQGVVCMEAMRSIHDPAYAVIREKIGELGTLREASVRFSKFSPRARNFDKGEVPHVLNPRFCTGSTLDIGCYPIDWTVATFGAPKRIQAMGVVVPVPGVAEDDPYRMVDLAGNAHFAYDGFVAEVSWGEVYNNHLDTQIAGEEATLLVDRQSEPKRVTLVKPKPHVGKGWGTGEGEASDVEIPHVDDNIQSELEDFVAGIRGEEAPHMSVADQAQITLDSAEAMDEIRRQMGVVFPCD